MDRLIRWFSGSLSNTGLLKRTRSVLIKLGDKNRTGAVVAAMNRGWLLE